MPPRRKRPRPRPNWTMWPRRWRAWSSWQPGSPMTAEQTLPEPGPLESAKSYREKKAKPLWGQVVKVLRSVYRAYLNLKSEFSHLQEQYNRAVSRCNSFSARLDDVLAENKALHGTAADYERVKRAFGPKEVERAVEAAKQQEQAEKERRRGSRQKARASTR